MTGPTAGGKTALGVELARRLGAEIVSLDSMAIYRKMDVGTAKPTLEERGGIPHHMLDVVEPSEEFSTAEYLRQAGKVVRGIESRGKVALFVGGTPLYLKTALFGVFEAPGADREYREELAELERREGPGTLWSKLREVDPVACERIHANDAKRLIRALEVYRATGRPIFTHASWNEAPYYTPHGGAKEYAPDDYFGGDLNGITEKLPYIASLGVTCIYLNPIFTAHSNHRYNTADYRSIDPLLGTEDDFKALCDAAKVLGIRIVLDGVFSHTGDDSIYFDRYGRYKMHGACESKDSPYYPWYRFHDYPNTYECWWNFETLPDVEETEPSYTEFIQGENGVLRKWLALGASGWRLDVADELPDSFIRGVRRSIKSFDSDAVLIGEVWDNCATKIGPEGRRGYVNGDELDAPMNYQFREPAIEFLNGRRDAYWFAETQNRLLEDYPKPFMDACLNLLGSHDTERVRTALTGIPDARTLTRKQQLAHHPDAAALAHASKRLILGYALMAALPGVPCIYYGDEAGMTGMSDPLNRGTFPWGREKTALTEQVRALMKLHNGSDAIKNGSTRIAAVGKQTVAVIRRSERETLILLANASDAAVRTVLFAGLFREGPDANEPLNLSGTYRSEGGEVVTARSSLTLTVPANGYKLLRKL
ncbi:MAG: tRNA (adenosine(37)-N6)-dimethylallyltransferase MiaA [Clostridia bacterium]|nr:tRNA (adenosine(37)-N6)-dimethylallyltransferase MiaA [Clostridia bacterium]